MHMKRKIVQHGPSSLSITLPSVWVKKHKVEKGSEVDVHEIGANLIIGKSISENKTLHVDMSSFSPFLGASFVIHAYKQGYDVLKIKYDNHLILKNIQEATHELMGFEIVEQNIHGCTLQIVSSHFNIDFDSALRKVFFILKEMLEVIENACRDGKQDYLKNLYLQDVEVNRLCNFCLRQINRNKIEHHLEDSYVVYHIIEILEALGNSIKTLASLAPTKKLVGLLKSLQLQYHASQTYFYKPSLTLASEVQTHAEAIAKQSKELLEDDISAQLAQCVHFIEEATHYIQEFTICKLSELGSQQAEAEKERTKNKEVKNSEMT